MRFAKKLVSLLMLALAAYCGTASAQAPSPNFNGDVQEQDFPCAIVLCFANPKGPTAESKCQPPVNWLINNFIKKFKPWPTCLFNDKDNTQVAYYSQPHVQCPSGFTAEQATTDNGSVVLTGVCLRPVQTCAAYSPSVAGAACYTYVTTNDFGTPSTQYFEYTIPPNGVTSYAMRVYNGSMDNSYYFNLGGSSSGYQSASILYKNGNANNSSNASAGSGN